MNTPNTLGRSIALFLLTTGAPLLTRICRRLGVEPARHEERSFEDGEHKLRPLESVRGREPVRWKLQKRHPPLLCRFRST